MSKEKPHTVIVTGDVTMDWNLARTRRSRLGSSVWSADDTTSTYWQRGGAALLADLIAAVGDDLRPNGGRPIDIRQPGSPKNVREVITGDPRFHHSYAMWSPFKYSEKPLFDKEKPAWRVEEFLGLDRASSDAEKGWQKIGDGSLEADLIVLDDANLGFRDTPDFWPAAFKSQGKNQPWIISKMAKPLVQGPLWEQLHKNWANRLILVATVDDLRLSEVQISCELSWERTAQDVFWELVHNPCINSISHCAHVIVSFGPAGAILLSRREEKQGAAFECSLFFDPRIIEGMWKQEYAGGMIGANTCLTAGIVRQVLLSPENPDIPAGVQAGLGAIRTLYIEGYGERGTSASQAKLAFPIQKITTVLSQDSKSFTVAKVQDPTRFVQKMGSSKEKPLVEGYWTILHDRYQGTLDQLAYQVVTESPENGLQGVPWGQFGNLLTVDRQEIESYRSVRSLVYEYCRQGQQKKPLSIAVFGPPGSGKSFGIVEIANSLLPGQIEVREFNLSQLDSVESLIAAFHQVRDIGLSGKIPLIFWDEFDSSLEGISLGWLRYFLAPMQDGRFQEGQIGHPIGRAIFVFAGGTSARMVDFGQGLDPEKLRSVKGSDFISRLKGYINVLGPNPIKVSDQKQISDPYYIIRRAILLRSILKRNAPQLFEKRSGKDVLNIDHGLLRAFLKIGIYKHGARSMESIIAMSQLTGKTNFERSSLPSESQLDLHVDGKSFLSLVQQIELEGKLLEDLAEAAHDVYCEGLRARGIKYGHVRDEKLKTNDLLVPYVELSEDMKEQNRENVRDIPTKLAMVGYIMIPARSNEPPFNFPGVDLEKLAKDEHERWMQPKLADGWAHGPKTDRAKKLNQCLVPWEKLPEEEKEKDRDLVRGIPDILARAGYAIVKSNV
jgi:hypothetical protein